MLSFIDTESLTYLKLRSQAIGGNACALTNNLLRYIDKSFNVMHGFVCVLKTTGNDSIIFYIEHYFLNN